MNLRIYSYKKIDKNEYPNKYSCRKYLNIQIYSSHSAPESSDSPESLESPELSNSQA